MREIDIENRAAGVARKMQLGNFGPRCEENLKSGGVLIRCRHKTMRTS